MKKDAYRIKEKLRTLRVVVAFESNNVLVAVVSIMELLAVMRANEVIVVCCGEKCRDKRVSYVLDRRQLVDVESRLVVDRVGHQFQGWTDQKRRQFDVLVGQLVYQGRQV